MPAKAGGKDRTMAITIRHGVNTIAVDTAVGKTVEELRDQVSELLNVPDSAQVRVNGAPVDDDTVLQDNSTVEFVKVAGEKGA
jgi:molybdopterin converting factor small subunit